MPEKRDNFVAIACGGTGGHLFPGMAVGEKLLERGYDVLLLVSEKEVIKSVQGALPGWKFFAFQQSLCLREISPNFSGRF